jgi:hypothetical protein
VSGASSFHHVAAVNETQRGMVAARKANLKAGRPTSQEDTTPDRRSISQEAAGDDFQVSVRTVSRCKLILKHGTPDEIAACDRGKASADATAGLIKNRLNSATKETATYHAE